MDMDNYFRGCPAMMEDGRLFTDYRSSQVREELFRYKNCVVSENEARTLRIDNGETIMDDEWDHLRKTRSCFPREHCYHTHPTTRVTSAYNNAEILANNGLLPRPKCNVGCHDYRLTVSTGSKKGRPGCKTTRVVGGGYPLERCPSRCAKTNRLLPEKLRTIDNKY